MYHYAMRNLSDNVIDIKFYLRRLAEHGDVIAIYFHGTVRYRDLGKANLLLDEKLNNPNVSQCLFSALRYLSEIVGVQMMIFAFSNWRCYKFSSYFQFKRSQKCKISSVNRVSWK